MIKDKFLHARHYPCKEKLHVTAFGETFTGPSLTIPDQSLSLKDLLERYVMGQSVETFQGHYNGEDHDVPLGIERMDQLEKLDLARQVRQGIKEAQENLSRKPSPPPPTPPPSGEEVK